MNIYVQRIHADVRQLRKVLVSVSVNIETMSVSVPPDEFDLE